MTDVHGDQQYWDLRAESRFDYRGETLYTISAAPFYVARRDILLKDLDALVASNDVSRICDYGCGDGWYLDWLSTRYPGKTFYGVDYSESMLALARERAPTCEYVQSGNGLGRDKDFDLVYSVAVLAHVPDDTLQVILQDIFERLRPGGAFILFEQTGPKRRDFTTGSRRESGFYTSMGQEVGFRVVTRKLIYFRAHRFFERRVAPWVYLAIGGGSSARGARRANRSRAFRRISSFFVALSRKRIWPDAGVMEGNSLIVFQKESSWPCCG